MTTNTWNYCLKFSLCLSFSAIFAMEKVKQKFSAQWLRLNYWWPRHQTAVSKACYRPQLSWGKVMFLQASAILLKGGCLVPGVGAWSWKGSAPGGCLVPGRVPGPGGCAWSWGGCLVLGGLQAHTQGGNWGGSGPGPHPGGNWGGSDPGPHPRGKLRWIRSRSILKGEIEGDEVQAHTQGAYWGGIRSRPTPKGEIEWDHVQPSPPHMATAVGGTHPTGMHSCISFKCS